MVYAPCIYTFLNSLKLKIYLGRYRCPASDMNGRDALLGERKNGVGKGTRTLDFQDHNLAL